MAGLAGCKKGKYKYYLTKKIFKFSNFQACPSSKP